MKKTRLQIHLQTGMRNILRLSFVQSINRFTIWANLAAAHHTRSHSQGGTVAGACSSAWYLFMNSFSLVKGIDKIFLYFK